MFKDIHGHEVTEGTKVLIIYSDFYDPGDVNCWPGVVTNTYPSKKIVEVKHNSEILLRRHLKEKCLVADSPEVLMQALTGKVSAKPSKFDI